MRKPCPHSDSTDVQAMKASRSLVEGSHVKPAPWEGDLMVECRVVIRRKAKSIQRSKSSIISKAEGELLSG